MLYNAEKLGRAPVMRKIEREEPEVDTSDWKGERFYHVPRVVKVQPDAPKLTGAEQKIAARDARRKKLVDMIGKDLTETDLAATLGVSRTCIRADLKALGLKA